MESRLAFIAIESRLAFIAMESRLAFIAMPSNCEGRHDLRLVLEVELN